MNKESTEDIVVKFSRFTFSVRLKSIFFPVELADLLPLLEETGYSVRREILDTVPQAPPGARLLAGGTIAERRDVGQLFRMEPDRGVIAIAGKDIASVIEDFDRIEKLMGDRLYVIIEQEARFYELTSEGSANTEEDPTAVIARLQEGNDFFNKASQVLGFSSTNFGVRIVEQNRLVTDNEWCDIRIEPLVMKPDRSYHISVVYRHPDRAKAVKMAHSLVDTIRQIISLMEH